MGPQLCAIVLIKDFESAKSRLAAELDADGRRSLARANALRALEAAGAADVVLAVAGSEEAGRMARSRGAQVIVEPSPAGQNGAAAAGLAWVLEQGLEEALLLSSDLPLVTPAAVSALVRQARALPRPAAVGAAAIGRGGTNALYLSPPDAVGLHFGADSLGLFEQDARSRGVTFAIHESPQLALDLDEPEDLERLHLLTAAAG